MEDKKKEVKLEKEDYYMEGTRLVFTEEYHIKRGYCCGSSGKCRHCPYEHIKGKYPQIDANIRNCVRNEDNK